MGKNKFQQPENQFTQVGTATPKFQKLQQSFKQKNTLSVSISRNEEFVRKTFSLDGKTVFTARNIRQMEKTVFHQPEKLLKNWPARFDNGFHQQKTQNIISPRQERILQLLFLLVETIIETFKK